MKLNYLFPHKYKRIGWMILVPSVLFGLYVVIYDLEPAFLDFTLPSFTNDDSGDRFIFADRQNNLLNEILGVLVIIASLLVAFSRELEEDEFIAKLRLESLVWGVYLNYGIMILAFIFVFGISFLWVMIFNMYTILWFFIIRFNWQLYTLKKSGYEE